MPVTDPMRRETADTDPAVGTTLALAISGTVLSAAFVISAWALPSQLVLPVMCLAALATAAVVALVAWTRRTPDRRHPTYWEIAGALTFIGMCAAILSEPDQVVRLFEVAPSAN